MVAEALALPWCKLSESEINSVYGIKDSETALSQPSYRNWEVKARMDFLHAECRCPELDGHLPKVLPRNRSWPFLQKESIGSIGLDKHLHGHLVLDSGICWDSGIALQRTKLPGPQKNCISPFFRNWEVNLRHVHLQDLYGPPTPEPSYRNWEVSRKRQHHDSM